MYIRKSRGCNKIPKNMIYNKKNISTLPRDMMNVGRYKNAKCNSICMNNSMFIGYKNNVNNVHLANVSTATRISNLFKGATLQRSKKIIKPICIDKQFGTLCGKIGNGIKNKF
jgi:hypothetical protein|tara:strand:+ start:928 stop:1266 length:339 start_codon:yes stop_codon:yes gene_type:complete